MSCAELVLDVDTKTQRVILKKKVLYKITQNKHTHWEIYIKSHAVTVFLKAGYSMDCLESLLLKFREEEEKKIAQS